MKLLIVTPWPLSTPGGGQRLAREIGTALATDYGIDVLVAAGSGLSERPPCAEEASGIREVRVPLVSSPGSNRPDPHRDLSTARSLQGLDAVAEQMRPDIILYTPHYSSCAVQAAALAARSRLPFVFLPAVHLDHRLHTSRAARRFYRSADLVVCLSDVERLWLVRRARVPPERVLTVDCGWSGSAHRRVRRISAPGGPIPRHPGDPLRALAVGAFVRHKQLDHQLEAVAHLRDEHQVDAHLTVAGALHQPAVLDRLRHLARRCGLEGNVEFLTDCADSVIARLHDVADVFFFTSRSESFGMAVLDAIGFGTVPIVYPHPIYGGLVEASGFGVLARRSTPKALAHAVLRVLDSPAGCEDQRLRWLRQRSWRHAAGPLAETLARITTTAGHAHRRSTSHPVSVSPP